jgi:hypothetical protein
MVGEASISLATACFGNSVNGNAGHDQNDVLYIAFPGSTAVPGANGAAWSASSYNDFATSIQALGDSLVARIGTTAGSGSNASSGSDNSGSNGGSHVGDDTGNGIEISNDSCSWPGHCAGKLRLLKVFECVTLMNDLGATCITEDDCSDALTCHSGRCG